MLGPAHRQLALELGMGRGRLAMQLFLNGATVIGVELASERYGLAVSAMERLAHRCPDSFEITKRSAQAVRIKRNGGWKGSICEVRLGSFMDAVPIKEVEAATLVFVQVCLPPPVWPRVKAFLSQTSPGCRLLTFENLRQVWGNIGHFPFAELGRPVLSCSWGQDKGHTFYCYERLEDPEADPPLTSS